MLFRNLPNGEKYKQAAGLGLFAIGMAIAGLLLLCFMWTQASIIGFDCLLLASLLALPMGLFYLTVPRLLDRYDPEPWYALLGCLLWGAIAACGLSGQLNTLFSEIVFHITDDPDAANNAGAIIAAPFFEEISKGLAVWGVFFFLRRDFDGALDGIIYGCFAGLGFASVENIVYYGRALAEGGPEALGSTFLMRGVMSPWIHPLFTALTGIGLGVARERGGYWTFFGPVFGLSSAMFLHFVWNGAATLLGASVIGFAFQMAMGFVLLVIFVAGILYLVRRRGLVLKRYLADELALGAITAEEFELSTSVFGLLKARFRYGGTGVTLVRRVARLGLSKWHTERANRARTATLSMAFVGPLRREIAQLRASIRAGRVAAFFA